MVVKQGLQFHNRSNTHVNQYPVSATVRVWVCVCFHIIPYVNCFGRTVHYVCIGYCIQVNMYDVNAQGVDESMINVHYYYCASKAVCLSVFML